MSGLKLRDYLLEQGHSLVDQSYYSLIDIWSKWYKGTVSDFHNYSVYTGEKAVRMTRARLGMAKQGCEFWASLLWNSDCEIVVEAAPETATAVAEALQHNRFTDRFTRLTESAFALGTGAMVAYEKDGKPHIEYISDPHKILPLEWQDDEIISCAFATVNTVDGKRQLYLMIHERIEIGYRIRNEFFVMDREGYLTPIETPEGIREEYTSTTKLFAIIKPNIVNNSEDTDSPLGMSVFANSIAQLKAVDLAFDGMTVSMQIGRPRIGVGVEATKVRLSDGSEIPVFDPNDIAFSILPAGMGPNAETLIRDMTTQYRAGEFEASLEKALQLFGMGIGLGEKAFKWTSSSVATATQVISDNAQMLRTMEKHQSQLETAVIDIVRAVLDIMQRDPRSEITVKFDDSVTRDRAAERQRFFQYVQSGFFPMWKFLVEFEGMPELDAINLANEAREQQSMGNSFFPPGE